MSEDLWVRCTGCGSVLTAPAFVDYMWECRMCHSVFPVAKSEGAHVENPNPRSVVLSR